MKKFFIKILYPLVKLGKPYLRLYIRETVTPYLQEKINAGAIDKSVDQIIKKVLDELIDKI